MHFRAKLRKLALPIFSESKNQMTRFNFFSMVLVGLCCAVSAPAQWTMQEIKTTASLRGLSAVNANVVWASGTGGTVLRTLNGGTTWEVIQVPDADKLDFRDIEAFDEKTAYILSIGNGAASRIYKTTDGGKTWWLSYQNTNEQAFFDAIAFWDKDHGLAMSDPVSIAGKGRFLILTTDDGGKSWTLLENQPYGFRSCVVWADGVWVTAGTSGSDYLLAPHSPWIGLGRGKFNSVQFTQGIGWAVGPDGRVGKFVGKLK